MTGDNCADSASNSTRTLSSSTRRTVEVVSAGCCDESVRKSLTSASRRNCSTRAAGLSGSMGRYAAPVLRTPNSATIRSDDPSSSRPTMSPREIVWRINQFARRLDRVSSSSNESATSPLTTAMAAGVRRACSLKWTWTKRSLGNGIAMSFQSVSRCCSVGLISGRWLIAWLGSAISVCNMNSNWSSNRSADPASSRCGAYEMPIESRRPGTIPSTSG